MISRWGLYKRVKTDFVPHLASPASTYESSPVERFLTKSFLIGSNPQAISS